MEDLDGYKLDDPRATDDELIEVLNLISKAKNLYYILVVASYPQTPMLNLENLRNCQASSYTYLDGTRCLRPRP